MATILWRGDAMAIAQVNTLAVGAVSTGIVYSITINSKVIAYTAAGTDTSTTVAAGLCALLTASGVAAEFAELNWSNPSAGVIVATAGTAGVPFTLAATATSTGTFTSTTSTANSGPADASIPANWSTGSLPTTGDNVVFTTTANPCLYNLQILAGVNTASLTIDQTFTGTIGLPRNNSKGYIEYRPHYLQISPALITIGQGSGAGSGRIKIDTGSIQTSLSIFNSGSPADAGINSILWKGTNAANAVFISRGSFSAAYLEGENATIATLTQGFQTNQAGDTVVALSGGCTLGAINKSGGSLTVAASFTTLTQGAGNAGTTTITGGTPGTVSCTGGKVIWQTAAGWTNLTVSEKGIVDFSQDGRPRTGTNTTLGSGGALLDPDKSITFTNPIALGGCGLQDLTLDLGVGLNLQRS